jgi:hypothetical protein
MNANNSTINWLLEGDPAIQFQAKRDLLGTCDLALQKRIAQEGWGKQYLQKRRADGHWGAAFYHPKWTSSHYTLLDLRNLNIDPHHPEIRESIAMIAKNEKGSDGGINPAGTIKQSDVCINGMFLNYAAYFKTEAESLYSVVDFILSQIMPDGGFNCHSNRRNAKHSSVHSTISVLEGIAEYQRNDYSYRLDELEAAANSSREFLLMHQLYLSDRTGQVIKSEFTRLPYPHRWRYNNLRALDHFAYIGAPYDERMGKALKLILKKRLKDGRWKLNAKYPGQSHFDMEKAGQVSRWNTLLALRVLKKYDSNAIY